MECDALARRSADKGCTEQVRISFSCRCAGHLTRRLARSGRPPDNGQIRPAMSHFQFLSRLKLAGTGLGRIVIAASWDRRLLSVARVGEHRRHRAQCWVVIRRATTLRQRDRQSLTSRAACRHPAARLSTQKQTVCRLVIAAAIDANAAAILSLASAA